MSNSDFLSFLVNETFKLQKSGEDKLSSFELKLNDYGLTFFKGEFLPQLQVLRFKTSFGILDAPVNWSIFSVDKHPDDHTLLENDKDIDHLFSVFKAAWDVDLQQVLVTQADGFCYLVGLKRGEEGYLHDLLNPQEWLKTA